MARRALGGKRNGTTYEEIFFTWSVPGVCLVIIGHMSGQDVFLHFGMALLSIGVYYYGRLKRLSRVWQIAWMALFSAYLTLSFYELLRRS